MFSYEIQRSFSGKKRNPNPNPMVRISSGGVWVFHVNGWGGKVRHVPRKPGKPNFLAGYPGQFSHPSFLCKCQDVGKGGLSLRGVAFMTVLAVLTVFAFLESTLPSFCLSYQMQHNEATVAALTEQKKIQS